MDAHLFSTSLVNIDPFFLVEIYKEQKWKQIYALKFCNMS
jgi:hypothetical protein